MNHVEELRFNIDLFIQEVHVESRGLSIFYSLVTTIIGLSIIKSLERVKEEGFSVISCSPFSIYKKKLFNIYTCMLSE